MTAARIVHGLGYELIELESCPSTNDYLKAPLPEDVDKNLPVFVRAVEQTAGQGRMGRSWSSPKGGVYLSLLWPKAVSAQEATGLPLVVACAVSAAVEPFSSQALAVKWPNDILMLTGSGSQSGRKLSGISAELVGGQPLIGVGVNVCPSGALPQTRPGGLPPAWLVAENLDEAEAEALVAEVAEALIHSLIGYLGRWQEGGGFAPFAEEYRRRMAQIGESVEVRDRLGGLVAAGVVEGVDDGGCLLLAGGQGMVAVASGEVTLAAG